MKILVLPKYLGFSLFFFKIKVLKWLKFMDFLYLFFKIIYSNLVKKQKYFHWKNTKV